MDFILDLGLSSKIELGPNQTKTADTDKSTFTLIQEPIEQAYKTEDKGFTKQYCEVCQRIQSHYKGAGDRESHCTEHSNPDRPVAQPLITESQAEKILNNPALPDEQELKALSEKDLFVQVRTDERFKIKDSTLEQVNERIAKMERIFIEAKGRMVELFNKKRELDDKSGVNRWDEKSGKKVKSHLANPEGFGALLEETKRHKKAFTKCEKAVKGMVELDESDEDIIKMFNGKFKLEEIKIALQHARENDNE